MGDGKKLKKLLKDKGISVHKLANITGINATTLYSIINRDGKIRYEWAVKIAKALNVTPGMISSEIAQVVEPIDFFSKAEASVPGSCELTFPPTDEQILEALIKYLRRMLTPQNDNIKSDNSRLKPCPFCGSKAEIEESHKFFAVGCTNTNCKVTAMTEWQCTLDEAIDAWNGRKGTI